MFHINLRRMREDAGYTQKEFADMLSIRVTTYRNYENTLREPSYDILVKMAEILGVSTDTLLGVKKATDFPYERLLRLLKQLSPEDIKMIEELSEFLLKRHSAV